MTEREELEYLRKMKRLKELEAKEQAFASKQAADNSAGMGLAPGNTPSLDEMREATYSQEVEDRETGAPKSIRFAVGLANDPEQKLARGKALLGDSFRAEGADNYSYVNPETGKRTLFNPTGLDLGDVPGAGRELLGLGGALGGGFFGGIPGAAAGGTALPQAADYLAEKFAEDYAKANNNPIPEGNQQRGKDAAIEFGAQYIGGKALPFIGKGLGKIVSPVKNDVSQAYKNLGLNPPSLGAISGKPVQILESALDSSLTGSGAIERARELGAKNIDRALDNISFNMVGGNVARTPSELGMSTVLSAKTSKDAFKREAAKRFGEFEERYGQAPATMGATRDVIDQMTSGLGGGAQAQALRSRLQSIVGDALADEEAGVLNVKGLSALRTRLFDKLAGEGLINNSTVTNGQLKALRKAVTNDLKTALGSTGDDALSQWEKLQGWYKKDESLRKFLDKRIFGGNIKNDVIDEGKIGQKLLNPTTMTRSTVTALKDVLPQRDFDLLRGGITRQLGTATSKGGLPEGQGDFNVAARLLGNNRRSSFSPEVQDMLFGNELDDFRTIVNAMADAGRTYNVSRTASANDALSMMRKLLPRAGANALAAYADLGTSLAAPFVLGQMTTRQPFIRMAEALSNQKLRNAMGKLLQGAGVAAGYGIAQ